MSCMLKSGTGNGQFAHIDDHNRLYTKSINVNPVAHHSTWHKNSYEATFEVTLQGTSKTTVMYLYNSDNTSDLEIHNIIQSSNANLEVETCVNCTFSSGGADVTPYNLNLGTSASPDITLKEGGSSGDLVVTGSNTINGLFLGAYAPATSEVQGGIIVTPKKSLCIQATGAASDRVKVSIIFAYHAAGTKL